MQRWYCTMAHLFTPEPKALIDMVDEEGISIFGTSANILQPWKRLVLRQNSHQLTGFKSHPVDRFAAVLMRALITSTGTSKAIFVCLLFPVVPIFFLFCFGLSNVAGIRRSVAMSWPGMAVEIWDDNGKHIEQKRGAGMHQAFLRCRLAFGMTRKSRNIDPLTSSNTLHLGAW